MPNPNNFRCYFRMLNPVWESDEAGGKKIGGYTEIGHIWGSLEDAGILARFESGLEDHLVSHRIQCWYRPELRNPHLRLDYGGRKFRIDSVTTDPEQIAATLYVTELT